MQRPTVHVPRYVSGYPTAHSRAHGSESSLSCKTGIPKTQGARERLLLLLPLLVLQSPSFPFCPCHRQIKVVMCVKAEVCEVVVCVKAWLNCYRQIEVVGM